MQIRSDKAAMLRDPTRASRCGRTMKGMLLTLNHKVGSRSQHHDVGNL